MDKMSNGIKTSLKPIIEDNNTNNSCDRSENKKKENNILFIKPFQINVVE